MITSAQMRQKMAIPPALKPAYEKIVNTGKQILFSDKTQPLVMQQLQSSPDIVHNIAQGIAGLMALLYKQSGNKLPPQLIVPAALELMTDVVEFVTASKMATLSKQQVSDITQATLDAVLKKFGTDTATAVSKMQQVGNKTAAPAAPSAPPGLVQGAMQ